MAQTTNKFQIIQKVSAEDTVLIHPETEAEVVKYKGTTSGIAAENIQGAIDKIYEQFKNIESGGIVTGLKGDKETTYRKGNVNLTPANIGAEPSGAVNAHNTSGTAHSDIRTAVTNAQNKANSAYSLAEGRAKAVSFDTVAAMTTALKAAAKTDYKVGDNIFIKALDTPDYWVSKVLEMKPIKEQDILDAFKRAVQRFVGDFSEIVKVVRETAEEELKSQQTSNLTAIEDELVEQRKAVLELFKEKRAGKISPTEYDGKYAEYSARIIELESAADTAKSEELQKQLTQSRLERVYELLDNIGTDYTDEGVMRALIDCIKVEGKHDIEFQFKCGVDIHETI